MAQFYHPVLKRMVEVPESQAPQDNAVGQAQQMQGAEADPEQAQKLMYQQMYNQAGTLKQRDAVASSWEQRTGEKLFPKVEQSETEKTRLSKKAEAEKIISQLEDMYFASKDLSSGRLGGIGEKIKSMFGFNEPLKSYESIISSIRPTLARAAGDVGALSEVEQKAAVKPLPTAYSTPEEAIAGFTAIRKRFSAPMRDYNDVLDEETKTALAPEFWTGLQQRLAGEQTLDDIYNKRKKAK